MVVISIHISPIVLISVFVWQLVMVWNWFEFVVRFRIGKNMLSRYEPRHEISNNVVYATSKASDQPAHKRRLIRAFASHLNTRLVLSY